MEVDFWFVPKDANHIPSVHARRRVEGRLEEYLPGMSYEHVHFHVSERLFFIDGEYAWYSMTKIGCSACRSEVSIASAWAEDLRERLLGEEVEFSLLHTRMPCCDTNLSVLHLDFNGRGGFARFAIKLGEASCEFSDENLLARLEKALGCPLRKIEIWYT